MAYWGEIGRGSHSHAHASSSDAAVHGLQRAVSQDDGTVHLSEEFDVTHVFELISRHGGERIRLFGLEYGVRLLLKHPDGTQICPERATTLLPSGYCGTHRRETVLLTIEGTSTALEVAVPVFCAEVLEDPQAYRDQVHARWDETAFVFVDNSNIFFNAQYIDGNAQPDLAVRISIPELCDVVRFGRRPKEQSVVGSSSGSGTHSPVWQAEYEKEGFSVHLEERRGGGEQMVDDALHAQAMAALDKDFGKGRLSQTLVLLSGDGNVNYGRTSFPGVVKKAMSINADLEARGRAPLWKVEIIAWERGLSGMLKNLRQAHPGYISIRLLNRYRDYVTYRESVGSKDKGKGARSKGKGKGRGAGSYGYCGSHSNYDGSRGRQIALCHFVSTPAGCTNQMCAFRHPEGYHGETGSQAKGKGKWKGKTSGHGHSPNGHYGGKGHQLFGKGKGRGSYHTTGKGKKGTIGGYRHGFGRGRDQG